VPAYPDAALIDSEVERTRDALLAERDQRARLVGAPVVRWDKKTPPRYLDRVVERLGLTDVERKMLTENGFVVLEKGMNSYGDAFDFVHRRELPLYVSADALLHAVFRSHAELLVYVEMENAIRLEKILKTMHEALPKAKSSYAAETAADIDVYLVVARNLLDLQNRVQPRGGFKLIPSAIGKGDVAAPWFKRWMNEKGPSPAKATVLFGRERKIDWSLFTPRGIYTRDELESYWLAFTWLARIELKMDVPREATLAAALADLAVRAGAIEDLKTFDGRLRAFAGPREDISPAALVDLGRGIDLKDVKHAGEELRARIGDRFPRAVPLENVDDASKLPPIATLLGVSVQPDLVALGKLARERDLRAADVAYTFGHDAATKHQKKDADDVAKKAEARSALKNGLPHEDAYAAWFNVVQSLSAEDKAAATERAPTFFGSSAWADASMSSTIAGYGAIRNVYALLTPIVYRTGSCTIPDAYVEPRPAFFSALERYAEQMAKLAPLMKDVVALDEAERNERRKKKAMAAAATSGPRGPKATTTDAGAGAGAGADDDLSNWLGDAREYMDGTPSDVMQQPERFVKTIRALRAIVDDEIAGRPLSSKELAFLGMVTEYYPFNMYDEEKTPPRYNGWYPRLFASRRDAFATVRYAGDLYSSGRSKNVMQLGAVEPRLGVFVVDSQGEPRVVVGPVTHSVERIVDPTDTKTAEFLAHDTPSLPWDAHFVAPARTGPLAKSSPGLAQLSRSGAVTIEHVLTDLDGVTLEQTDPHGATLASGLITTAPDRKKIDPTKVVLTPLTPKAGASSKTAEPSHVFMRLRDSSGAVCEIQLWDEGYKGLKRNRR
jgi:hypothetical protein